MIDETHGIGLRSWVDSANDGGGDFPIQNLPFGVFRHGSGARIGVAIGDRILDLTAAATAGLLGDPTSTVIQRCAATSLNPLMALGRTEWAHVRRQVSQVLRTDTDVGQRARQAQGAMLVAMDDVEMLLPARVGDYTDFYASIHHATNVGTMLRPDQPLFPNYKWVPIGYHGRASSLVVSGTPVRRPGGQSRRDATAPPSMGPTTSLDYELELGLYIGTGNALGTPVPIHDAGDLVFGMSLVNDWSARDIQAWEYQPLGPFLGKSFATSVSPWIVTRAALAPFRVPAAARPDGDPIPLPYLDDVADRAHGGLAIQVEASLSSRRMRAEGRAPRPMSRGCFDTMYWTVAQLIAHHASNGCNLQPGDLLASGTISGATPDSRGCLLELTWRGRDPIVLPTGETRRFLEDGDEVIFRAWCERDGFARIGFGDCRGIVTAAI